MLYHSKEGLCKSKVRFLHSGERLRNLTLLLAEEEGGRGHLSLHMNGSLSTKLSEQLGMSPEIPRLPESKWCKERVWVYMIVA